MFDPDGQNKMTDPFAVIRRFIKPHRDRLDFQVNQIGLINSRGTNLHPTELAQSEQELTDQIDDDEYNCKARDTWNMLLYVIRVGSVSFINLPYAE